MDLKCFLSGIFDSLVAIAKAPLNLIIRAINTLIDGANKIHIDIPDYVPGFGGKSFGVNIPKIPLLERGTVLTKPTQFIGGENGAEAIMPLENHTEWIDYLADKIASKIGSGGGAYVLNIDGRTVLRGIAKREHELSSAMHGKQLC